MTGDISEGAFEEKREELFVADKEQLELLMHSVIEWNIGRRKHPEIRPDLSGANLAGADLHEAELSGANLAGVDLRGANLIRAYLSGANLAGTDLSGAYLIGANLSRAYSSKADLRGACLTHANFMETDLTEAKGLSQEQIDTIYGNQTTKIPLNLQRPKKWD